MSDTIDTTTLPPLADAMTARDLELHEDALVKLLGKGAYVHISHTRRYSESGWAYVSMNPKGICGPDSERVCVYGETWPEAVAKAQAWIAARPKVERNAIIRKLALAIIELTDENGRCTVAMLRAKGFDSDEIALHAEACQRASEMCANSPFCVEGAP